LKETYEDPDLAGVETRTISVLDAQDHVLCTSNQVETLKLEVSDADKVCIEYGGQLEKVEDAYSVCAIGSWTLYRAMDERGLIPQVAAPGDSSLIGMANPASLNCSRIGGFERPGINGGDSACRISKNKLPN
jgi:putative hemolysin